MQRTLHDNTQQSQQTDIHVPGGIQTRNPSKRATADPSPRPRGHRDRHQTDYKRYTRLREQTAHMFSQILWLSISALPGNLKYVSSLNFSVGNALKQWRTKGVQTPLPQIPKALQNRAKLNPIVKTVKNC